MGGSFHRTICAGKFHTQRGIKLIAIGAPCSAAPPPPRPSRSISVSPLLHLSSSGVCGLRNLGNTCFVNSAIQFLSCNAELVQYFMDAENMKSDLNTVNPLGKQGKLAQAYQVL